MKISNNDKKWFRFFTVFLYLSNTLSIYIYICACVCVCVCVCDGYRRWEWTRKSVFKILDEDVLISHCTNTLGKGMNPIILSPVIGK